jgi:hypothetical protein
MMAPTGRAVSSGLGQDGSLGARHLLREAGASACPTAAPRRRASPPRCARSAPGLRIALGGFDGPARRRRLVVASPGVAHVDDPFFARPARCGLPGGRRHRAVRARRARRRSRRHHRHQRQEHGDLAGRRMAARAGLARARRRQSRRRRRSSCWKASRRDLYVLELSSYQLETTDAGELAAATVLNVTPITSTATPTMAAYAAAKARVLRALRHGGRQCRRRAGGGDGGRAGACRVQLRAGVRRRLSIARARTARRWLMRRGQPLLPLDAAAARRAAQRGQRAGLAGARRGAGAAARGDARGAARVSRPASPRAVGRGRSAACATSTIPRAPMSAPRWRRWRACRARCC